MTKRGWIGGLMVAGALSGATATIANGGGARDDTLLRFTAIGKLDRAHVVDNEPAGPSPGDVLVFTQTLHNERETRVLGTSRGECTRTASPSGDQLCSGAFALRGRGEIMIQGIEPPAGVARHRHAVSGGTRSYRGVRGEIAVQHLSPTEDRLRFILSR